MKDNLDLFPDHPAPKPATMLELVAMPGIKLSPTQRAFKQLVQKIEAIEQQLKEIAGLADVFRPLFDKTLQPLQEQQDKVNREMVLFLDAQLQRKGWTGNQRATMREIVCQTAELLIGSAFDEEAKTIFDRHSDSPVAELTAALEAEIEEMFGGTSGKDGDEPRSPEEMFNDAMRMLEEGEEQAAREVEARAAAKRGGKQSARQQKAAQQALDAGKLLKEIYRKLTSVLHPDREPDEAERVRKTALMSEANKAYENKNLMKLLQLQLQASKFDSLTAATLADEKLQLINQTLKEQYSELQLEYQHLEMMVRGEFTPEYWGLLNAPAIQKALKAKVAGAKANMKMLREDLAWIKGSNSSFKIWLKEQRQFMREEEQIEMVIEEMMVGVGRRRR